MANDSPYAQPSVEPTPSQHKSPWLIVAIVSGVLLILGLLCAGLLAALLLPAISAARDAARTAQSTNNLQVIGLALHHYHSEYNSLPPAYSTDPEGKPLLSWRVALLPYLEQAPLYEQFHLDQPWDSPHNRSLISQMPEVYRSPNALESTPPDETNYVAVRDPASTFPPNGQPVKFRDVPDGLSNTIMSIEVFETTVPWSKPDDLSPSQAYQEISSSHVSRTNALLADGSVIGLEPTTERSTFDAHVTRDGGEVIP